MYIRTTTRRNKDGSLVKYYQLAHNVRHSQSKRPVAQIIHNFGRADRVDREELVRLAKSIARVCGLVVHDTLEQNTHVRDRASLGKDVKLIRTYELGTVVAVEAIWEKLGIRTILQ
jgi:hypothetical protein